MKLPIALMACLLAACVATPEQTPEPTTRPMDEVPDQRRLPNGDREYGFANGCRIVIDDVQAVVKSEAAACELYHRDIALLYAAGD